MTIQQFIGRTPLRIFIIVPFVIQIFLAVGLVGYLSFQTGRQSVDNVVNQLLRETTGRFLEELGGFLDVPHKINRLNAESLKSGLLNLDDKAELERQIINQYFQFNISGIGIATEQDEYNEILSVPDNKTIVGVSGKETNYELREWYIEKDGQRTGEFKTIPGYYPTKRPWYQAAVKKGEAAWSDIYTFVAYKTLAITGSMPIFDKTGGRIAVTATGLQLSYISQFLSERSIGKTGMAFIIERSGLLVASSDLKQELAIFPQDAKPQRVAANESKNQLIASSFQKLTEKSGLLNSINNPQTFIFDIGNSPHYLKVTPYIDKKGIDWLIIIVIPESDFMSEINQNTRMTIYISLAALILALMIGITTARWITQPILSLNNAAKRVEKGEWNSGIVHVTRSDEVGQLAISFNSMATQLKESFELLDQRVIERTRDLKAAQAQLVQSEKMAGLGTMVSGVAHEINNPLTFSYAGALNTAEQAEELKQFIFKLAGDDFSDKIREAFEERFSRISNNVNAIVDGTLRIKSIVNDLRTFSRLDEEAWKHVNIVDGLKSTINLVQANYKERVEFITRFQVEPIIWCYPAQLNQVFMNIIINACQAMTENETMAAASSGKLIIDISRKEDNIVIVFDDNGRGIAPDILPKIFDPFFTTKPVGMGVGLGLAISYEIVQKHQGYIRVSSEVGKGSCFTIVLPIVDKPANM